MRDFLGRQGGDEDLEPTRADRVAPGKVSLTGRLASASAPPAETEPHPLAVAFASPVQRLADGASLDDPFAVHQAAARGVSGSGEALPHADAIQRSFGHHDVSGVRAHVGGRAADAAVAIGASAYATGDDVAFAAPPDLRQAAHETAHVVQQRGGVRLDGGVGRAGDVYEQHADAVADKVVRGESAEGLLDTLAHRGAAGGSAVQRDEGDGRGPAADRIEITSQTMLRANGAPDTRHTIGVGETVTFTASRAGAWTGPGAATGNHRLMNLTFNQPGEQTVTVRAGDREGTKVMNVVAPSIRVRKVTDRAFDDATIIGAWMELEFTLTPLNVSFAGMEIHEEECGPSGVWGYFATHQGRYARAMHHSPAAPQLTGTARPPWVGIDENHVVQAHDHAGLRFYYHEVNWPLRAGGFQWQIPQVYRINGVQHQFARAMTQTFHMDEDATMTIFKGGERVQRQTAQSTRDQARRRRQDADRRARERAREGGGGDD